METLKELLMPKTFNRLSYVAVIGWIVFGVILLGIVAEMENSEPSFSCSEKSENMDLVPQKCLQQYKKKYNQFGFPLYAFVILNFSLILFVCVIYSQVVKTKVELLEANLNRDAERQRPPETRKLFVAYCCQLAARLTLITFFIVLKFQLFYPSNFPTNFNCNLTLTGDSLAVNASGANIQNTTTYECHNQQGGKKTFWTNAVIVVNGVFLLILLTELIWILSRAKKDRRFMKDSHFFADHLKTANKVHPQQELASFVGIMKQKIIENTEKPTDLNALFTTNPGEGERNKDLSLDEIYTNLRLHPNRAKYDFSDDSSEESDFSVDSSEEYDFSQDREKQLKVYPEPKGRDVDAKNLQPKGPEDIVDAENRKVLIVGRPGIGKTLFCTKFLRDWAMGRVFNNTQDTEIQYNVAFLVKFRKFNSVENLSLRELLARSEYSQTELLPDGLWTYIRENPEKVLILLDGLDEFKDIPGIVGETVKNNYNDSVEQTMPPAAVFSKITNGKLLSGATVVTTTRPTAVSIIGVVPFNRVFEIVGFSSEQVKEYVENFTENAAENLRSAGAKIWQHISTNMNLFSLCYIPVNCFIICSCLLQVLKFFTMSGEDLSGVGLPTKLTEIYKMATKLFFFKHEQYRDKPVGRDEIESNELTPEVEKKFKRLGKVAFDGIKERRLIFKKSEVEGLEDSALFHQLPDRQIGPWTHEAQFCFIHLTMQEFFAAKHIVDTMNEEQLREFISNNIKKGEWHVVLQFVAGLLGEQNRPIEIFTDMLPLKTVKGDEGFTYWPTGRDKHLALTIIKCLFECENKESHSVVKSKLEEIVFNAVDFSSCRLAPSDCTAVVHALKNVPQISYINLYNNHIGSLHCVEIRKLLDNGNCQITRLDLYSNNIDDNGVLELCKGITNSKLTELYLSNNNITDVGVNNLCDVLTNPNCKLTWLILGWNIAITAEAKRRIRNAKPNCEVRI